ncbi:MULTISPECIES: poly-beta-1,6 N-acetyl-D-glucosamine export porin PgaA [unclassified Burkholderia]|uniref:poly-beta-1,6 N-acetyl-D-glucosamine export porin PgaA n=1 Tax=unclassified Burkholderia TaxID=2613784 RepID=UPI000F55AE60|nr:poly-beta-1,6 N-acetyl-D-glucosamine export porin PgaA [Burkholderia sp. Bp9011]RQR86157.1 poly-beta-1,6 N-acetyl-D-glucosamine export porin PgaA [Burkholderia sp. Bp9010]RQS00940.1 poly-beta-1,6 N-acetyl-D-glucosamine export porin PgaA [Burkholderia sp. Bp8991]RQS67568.1 poly-beta-1,6 N-acetyl-D-glucosamine export porin PgaA [Burkholderia sp. Bp8977]
MANNRQQQCTTVAPPNRRILLHAPLLLLLIASGSCLAAEGDAEPGSAREVAGTHGAPDALPPGMQPTEASMRLAQGPDALPPHAPTPIAQASDASMQIAQAANPQPQAMPTTVVVEPDAAQPSEPAPDARSSDAQTQQLAQAPDIASPNMSAPAAQSSDASIPLAQAPDTAPPNTSAPAAQSSDASIQLAQAPDTVPPNTSAPAAQSSDASIPLAQAPDTAPPNTSAPAAQSSDASIPLAQAPDTAPPNTSAPVAHASDAPTQPAPAAAAASPNAATTATTPTQTAQASGTPMPTSPAPVTQTPGAQPPSSQAPNSQTPGAQLPGESIQRSQGPDVQTPNAQIPNLRTADVATVRNDVFGLAASGGAIQALEEAKARPDAFSAVDVAQLEELSIRQQVRGGRDKSRSMTSPDRFDGIDNALRAADDLDKRMPATPDYAPVRTALAGDRTVALAARGDMKPAVATFETIPSNAEISIDALAAVGDAYLYLSEPAKANGVYQRALNQATASPTDRATRGFQYGARTRPIELREGLFWSYVDQARAADAKQVLDDMGKSLPPVNEVRNVGPEESDYLRYYRLRAQYLIFTGHTDEGIAALEQLEKEVPFNAEVRAAHADAVSGQSHPRQAIAMYRASLTDHPDSVEMLAGLGRAALTADDYATAKNVDQTLDNTFPDSGAVRSFKRDYKAYRSPVFTTDLSFEHGNSALADNSFTSDSYVYSQPFGDNWRVFSHTFFGHAQTDSGSVSRTRTGVGGDYRHGPLTVQGEVTRSFGSDGRTGGRGSIAYALNDYWTVSAGLDSNDNSLPWKAYAAHIWGRSANASVVYRQNDRREVKLSYGVSRYSDSNLHQEITATATQRVYTSARQLVNVSLDLGTDSNTRNDAPYFSPRRDYAAAATVMHQLTLWKKGDMSLQQRVSASGGVYNERGFGSSPLWSARLEHAWTFKHDITLSYGVEVSSHAYDGQRERSETGFLSLNLPF